ncbi:MAG: ABC transporter substrate-binding protein [Tissierellia bacterium]|nr:ABC transporter substrate-binding protein [Tissierellia bacterium]
MKNKKILSLILVLALVATILTGCNTKERDEQIVQTGDITQETEANQDNRQEVEEYGITITDETVSFIDGRGEEVTLKKNPERVVVIYNSYLDIWMRNGGKIVGKIEESVGQAPIEGTEDAEIVGSLGSISAEKILSLEPDLVILISTQKSQMELVPILEENNIPFIAMEYYVKEDYFKLARLFSALNEREDLYEENVLKVKQEIESIIDKSPKDKEYKVLIMMASAKSVTARGSDSTVGEMLQDLHTINIADYSNDALSTSNFSIEKILEEDPDFIFVQTTGSDMDKVMERLKEDVESNPAWSSLSAVKNNRYIILPKDLYMFKPNHRYAEAYEGLAKILYPDVFK